MASSSLEEMGASETAAGFHLGYRRWLDGLRGLAILMVLAFHLGFLPGGSLGVDVFFVLSGFLITTLLAEEWQRRGSISLKAFYLRRALRLWPAFITLLVFCVLSSFLAASAEEAAIRRREVIVAGCYVVNWPNLHKTPMFLLGHTWSLSVEEQFYLLWPLSLYLMLRWKLPRRRILVLVCAGILGSALLRLGLYRAGRDLGHGPDIIRLYMGLDTRADSLLTGCLVGLLATWGLLPRSRRFVFWAGLASLLSVAGLGFLAWRRCLEHSQYYHGLFTVAAMMVGVIIVRQLSAPSRLGKFVLQSAPLVGLGRISYGLYLYHIPILAFLLRTGLPPLAMALAAAGLTLATALLSYYCIERPCLRLKDRLGRLSPRGPASLALPGTDASAPPRAAA